MYKSSSDEDDIDVWLLITAVNKSRSSCVAEEVAAEMAASQFHLQQMRSWYHDTSADNQLTKLKFLINCQQHMKMPQSGNARQLKQ